MKCPGKVWLVDKYTQICIFLLSLITAFNYFKFKKYLQMEMCLDRWQKPPYLKKSKGYKS